MARFLDSADDIKKSVSKASSSGKTTKKKKKNLTTQERINQKSYGTTKPKVKTVTNRTANTVQRRTSSSGGSSNNTTQRYNNNPSGTVQRRNTQPTATSRNPRMQDTASSNNNTDIRQRMAASKQRREQAQADSERRRKESEERRNKVATSANPRMLDTARGTKIESENERAKRLEEARKQKNGDNSMASKSAQEVGNRIIKNLPKRAALTEGKIATSTGGAILDISDMLSGEGPGNGKSRDDLVSTAQQRKKQREGIAQTRNDIWAKRDEFEKKKNRLTKGAKGFEKAYYGAEESAQGMLSDFIASKATGGMWEVPLALRVYGESRGKAQQLGATETEDRLNAAKDALTEVVTEHIGGAFGMVGKLTGGSKLTTPFTKRLESSLAKRLEGKAGRDLATGALRWGSDVLGENVEEWIANPIQSAGENLIYKNRIQKERENETAAGLDNISRQIQETYMRDPQSRDAFVARLNSQSYRNELLEEYKGAGLTEKQANAVTDKMLEMMTAAATGDTKRMQEINEELNPILTGDIRNKIWDPEENRDSFFSTTLMTGVTSLPGSVTTSARGQAILDSPHSQEKIMHALRKTIAFDKENAASAKAMLDDMEKGYKPAATQAYDIMQNEAKVLKESSDAQAASERTKEQRMKRENIMAPPAMWTEEGRNEIVGTKTAERFMDAMNDTLDYIDVFNRGRREGKIEENDASKICSAVAKFDVGTFTVQEAYDLAQGDKIDRHVFEQMTGVKLDQYNVYDKRGNLDVQATNIKMRDGLLALSADNYMKSARIEQENWNDEARGRAKETFKKGLGSEGTTSMHDALEAVDPRDQRTFMATAYAANKVYEDATFSNDEWNAVETKYKKTFPTVNLSSLKSVYEAGRRDKAEAETPYLNAIVDRDKAIGKIENGDAVGVVKGNFVNETPFNEETGEGRDLTASEQIVYEELAKNFNANITMVAPDDERLFTDKADKESRGTKVNANVNIRTGEIFISNAADAGVIVHEFTHLGAVLAPAQYMQMADYVVDKAYKYDSEGTKALFDKYKNKLYKGKNLSDAQIKEEVVADLVTDFINDETFVREIAQEEPSLARQIYNAICEMLRKLRNIISTGHIKDEAVRDAFLSEIDAYEQTRKMWLTMMHEASKYNAMIGMENLQNQIHDESRQSISDDESRQSISETESSDIDSEGNAITEQEATVLHDIGPDVRFSMTTENESQAKAAFRAGKGEYRGFKNEMSGRELRTKLIKENFPESQANAIVNAIDSFMDAAGEFLTDKNGLRLKYQFIGWDDLESGTVSVRRDKNGKIRSVNFSAMKKNDEYPVNFDFSTVCNKRISFTKVIEEIAKAHDAETGASVFSEIKLTPDNMWKINEALKAEGIDTACLGCFVESRRYHIDTFFQNVEDRWNKPVREARRKLGLPEEDYFNFSKEEVPGEQWSAADDNWGDYGRAKAFKGAPLARTQVLMNEIVKAGDVDSPLLKLIRPSDLLTPEGFEGFRKLSNAKIDMVGQIKSMYGAGVPKEILGFTPYNSEVALLPKNYKKTKMEKYLKSIGGIRIQSFSDFMIEHVYDHFQLIADAAYRKLPIHAYTKVIAYAKIFGLTGAKINMSVMFDVKNSKQWAEDLGISEADAKQYADKYQGLRFVTETPAEYKTAYKNANTDEKLKKKYDKYISEGATEEEARRKTADWAVRPYRPITLEGKEGYLTYLVSDADYVNEQYQRMYNQYISEGLSEAEAERKANSNKPFEQSINYREAKALQDQDGYRENVGIIGVAFGDEHLRMMMDDENVRYIIPYHSSNLPVVVSNKTNLKVARDYSDRQNTYKAESWIIDGETYNDLKSAYAEFKKNNKDETHPARAFFADAFSKNLDAKFGDKVEGSNTGAFDVYKSLDTAKEISDVSERYLEDCIENNYIPVFHEFADSPGYYKMLFDFMVADDNGSLYPQHEVRNNYPGVDVDAKAAADEAVTDSDLSELKKVIEEGAKAQNDKLQKWQDRKGNVMQDLLSREGEHSIIADSNINSVRYGTEDYTNPKTGEGLPKDIKQSISMDLDEPYMDAVNAGNMEEAQKYVDEAAKRAGYTYHGYHGTAADFNVFETERSGQNWGGDSRLGPGIYFAHDEESADKWSQGTRMINAYLSMKKPLDLRQKTPSDLLPKVEEYYKKKIDDYEDWYPISREDYQKNLERLKGFDIDDPLSFLSHFKYDPDTEKMTDGMREVISELGYDGFISKDEMVVFDSSQVKSADTVTYAEDGSVIPLSERFDPTNNDIRYSMSTEDADGNVLTTNQMEYFKNSQARDENGRLVPVYHTTNKGGFTVFDPMRSDDHRSLFFSDDWDVSQTYGDYANSRFYYFDINNVEDVRKYLDAYSPDRYFLTQEQFEQAGGWEADFVDFEDVTNGEQSDFEDYLENPDGYIAVVGVPDYSPDNNSYADNWVMANTPEELVKELHNHFGWQRDNYTAGSQKGYYPCYLNLENPMIIDAHGQYWNEIAVGDLPIEEGTYFVAQPNVSGGLTLLLNGSRAVDVAKDEDEIANVLNRFFDIGESAQEGFDIAHELLMQQSHRPGDIRFDTEDLYPFFAIEMHDTRGWAEIAAEQGYDGVIFHNIIDIGGQSDFDGLDEESTVYIAFSSNQVKDINNENPTENPDIRYSITEDEGKSKKDYKHAMSDDYELLEAYEEMMLDEDLNASFADLSDEAYYSEYFGKMLEKYGKADKKARKTGKTVNVKYDNAADMLDAFYSALNEEVTMTYDDEILEEGRKTMAKSKRDFFSSVSQKWNERWISGGEVLDVDSVKTDIKNLVTGIMANSDTDKQYKIDLVKRTQIDMRNAYQFLKQGREDIASALLYHSALRMIQNVEFVRDDTEYQEYQGIRDYLRGEPIYMSEDYWQDEKFLEFRKAHYGTLKLRKGKTNVDTVYGQLADLFPGVFSEAERERLDFKDDKSGKLQHIGYVTELNLEPFMAAYSSEECADWAFEIADDLYEIMVNGYAVESIADEYKARNEKALEKERARTEKAVRTAKAYKEKYDAQAKAMKTRHAEAILRIRKARDEGIKAEKQKFKEYKETQKENRLHSKYFDSISATHKTLRERLLTNTKDKHIPEVYKAQLAELLASFDLQTVASKKVEARRGKPGQKTIKMSALRTTLKNMAAKSELFYLNDTITDIMDELLGIKQGDAYSRSIDGLTLDELNASELKQIDRMLKALLHEFNNYESVRVGTKRQQAADIGAAQIDACLEHAEKYGNGKDYQTPFLAGVNRVLNLDEVTPAYMFRQIDPKNQGIGLMFKELRRSFGKYVRNQNQINDWMEEILGEYQNHGKFANKYGADQIEQWRSVNNSKEFKLDSGQHIKLTPAQMMSILCLSNRQQAYDHMTGAGIVIRPVSFEAKLRSDIKDKGNYATPYMLTDTDIAMIKSQLTPDQVKVATKLQQLMATRMAEWGNEASMSVMGIRLFEDPDYFPIKSDKAALEKDFSADQFAEAIRNFGFTKAVQPGASNSIMVDDIFEVVAEHCNQMNLYNAYSESMNDFMRVYNYHKREDTETGYSDYSVEQAIAKAYSQKATTFIGTFIKDLNGNVSKDRTTGIDTLLNASLSNAKKASVFANGRVALQQPTALARAFYVIDPKYLKGFTMSKDTMKEMFEHSPIALWKSWGYYDINMGKSIEDLMMNNGSWLDDMMSDLYGQLDNRTWTAIWGMCKAEIEGLHPEVEKGSDEYWEMVSERMDEVVDLTQVVDSPFHRSHAMRSKDFFHKLTTSFMAEPTLTFNMVRDGLIRAHEAWKDGNKAEAGRIASRTILVFSLAGATTAAAAAIWDAVRGKGGDDDDEDKDLFGKMQAFFERWYDNFIENLQDNLFILNNIYYVKDVVSMFQGWDQRNLGFQGWKHLADAVGQLTGRKVNSKLTWYENFFAGVGYLSGLPIKTLISDTKSVFHLFGLQLPEPMQEYKDKLGSIGGGSAKSAKDVNSGASPASTAQKSQETSEGEKAKSSAVETHLWTYEDAPFHVEDGSLADRFLNHFGINLTSAEIAAAEQAKAEEERNEKIEDIRKKAEGLSGEAKDKKIWSAVTTYGKKENNETPLSDMIQNGNYDYVNELRDMYIKAGGNAEYFDERIYATSKTALKKSIHADATDSEIETQQRIKDYLLGHGMDEATMSDIVYKSYTAKDLKAAIMLNDADAAVTELRALLQAGLTDEDFYRLWDNRNKGRAQFIRSYREKGKYKDRFKSTGVYNWPIRGQITSNFGHRSSPGGIGSTYHQGMDIAGSMGDPVGASDGGTVVYAGWYGGAGKTVMIEHDDGTVTQYSHLSWWGVKKGDIVGQGQTIGNVGSTGNSTGPHLHFGVKVNGEYVDPASYLNRNAS